MKIEWIVFFIGVGIAVASFAVWLIARRSAPAPASTVNLGLIRNEATPGPPGSVSPGMVNALLDGSVGPSDIFLTVIDLAVRGHLCLTPLIGDDPEPYDWAVRRTSDQARGLRDFEATLLDAPVIAGKSGPAATLTSIVSDAEKSLKTALDQLRGAVARAGWFTRPGESTRQRLSWGVVGGVVLLIGLASAVLALIAGFKTRPWPGLAGAALMIASALLLITLTRLRPAITPIGDQTRGQVQRYRSWLTELQPHDIVPEQADDVFNTNLAPALAFGLGPSFAQVFDTASARHRNWGKALDIATPWLDAPDASLTARVDLLNHFLDDAVGLSKRAGLDEEDDR